MGEIQMSSLSFTETCLGNLRWAKSYFISGSDIKEHVRLQQLFEIVKMVDGKPSERATAWRDVPEVTLT